jgi:hypothetical protein
LNCHLTKKTPLPENTLKSAFPMDEIGDLCLQREDDMKVADGQRRRFTLN